MRKFNTIIMNYIHGRQVAQSDVEALHIAAYEDNTQLIRDLVEIKKVPVDAIHASIMSAAYDTTAFTLAVSQENCASVRLLSELGADVDFAKDTELSPLTGAAGSGDIDMVKLLLSLNANANFARESDYTTPLSSTASASSNIGHATKDDVERSFKIASHLISKGAKVEPFPHNPQTELMLAARSNQYKVVALFLKHGADPERKCGLKWARGWTALDHAINERSVEAADVLRKVTITPPIAKPGQVS